MYHTTYSLILYIIINSHLFLPLSHYFFFHKIIVQSHSVMHDGILCTHVCTLYYLILLSYQSLCCVSPIILVYQ